MIECFCRIETFLKGAFSWKREHSPNQKSSAKSRSGSAVATGDHTHVHIGDVYQINPDTENNPKTRFTRCLKALAHELPTNFRYVGNLQNPFHTQALERLVHDEPLVHQDPELFEKASACLNTAKILSTSAHPKLRPADGQFLMSDLAHYISEKYGIKVD